MTDLEELRKQIDSIDADMIRLFEKRMETSEAVALFKKQHGISVDDPGREDEIIRRNSGKISRKWRGSYRRFQKYLFKLSKAHQKKVLADNTTAEEEKQA